MYIRTIGIRPSFYQYDQFIGEQEINFADNFLKLFRSLILRQQLMLNIHEYFDLKKENVAWLYYDYNKKKLTERSQDMIYIIFADDIDDLSIIIEEKNQASREEGSIRFLSFLNANRQTLISTTNTKALNTIGAIERQSRTIRKYGKGGSFRFVPIRNAS